MSQVYIPKPHHQLGIKFLREHPRCNLFATPGAGKTGMVYSLLSVLQLAGSSYFPALVIAPKAVCEMTWPAEARKWTAFNDLRVVQLLGDEQMRTNGLLSWGDVYLINYENLPWLIQQYAGKPWPFKIVIADESTKLKNLAVHAKSNLANVTSQGSKRARALAAIAQHTGRWINLTGTPVPNGYQDLWGQQWFIDFGQRLGSDRSKYLKRWFVTNPYSRQTELRHPDCQHEIDRLLSDCTLSIRAEDWMNVQAPNYVEREVRLPQAAMALYKKMERDFWIEIQQLESRHEVTAVNAAALSQKLLQIASGTVIHDGKVATHVHDAKVEALQSIVDELQEPLLVAYWYKAEEALLKKAFPDFRIFKGADDEADWNAGKIKLMGVHPQSAGHGVNLQYGGRAMAHFTHTWNAELREQVEARIAPLRQQSAGFKRAVIHYDLLAAGTLDRDVRERVGQKLDVQTALLKAHARRMEEGSLI
jgi:SNF2 family DNA or RNA helicase